MELKPKDLQIIFGISYPTARKRKAEILAFVGKDSKQPLTIIDCSVFLACTPLDVRELLK